VEGYLQKEGGRRRDEINGYDSRDGRRNIFDGTVLVVYSLSLISLFTRE